MCVMLNKYSTIPYRLGDLFELVYTEMSKERLMFSLELIIEWKQAVIIDREKEREKIGKNVWRDMNI